MEVSIKYTKETLTESSKPPSNMQRSGDWNAKNRELWNETPHPNKYREIYLKLMKTNKTTVEGTAWDRFVCFLLGHKDPVMLLLGEFSQDKLYQLWRTERRKCTRCNKDLTRPNHNTV
jgi:hypothetical protein